MSIRNCTHESTQDLSSNRRGSRSSTTEINVMGSSPFLFTPVPPSATPSTSGTSSHRSASSPLLSPTRSNSSGPPNYTSEADPHESEDEEPIFTSWKASTRSVGQSATWSHSRSSTSLRSRIFGGSAQRRVRPSVITTAPGEPCAGETETEIDEPPANLPTSRITPPSGPLVPPDAMQQLTPVLFEFSRLLSIVPAFFGTLYNIYFAFNPPDRAIRIGGHEPPERTDYFVSALWAILTGYQCMSLATGLLTRWRIYYPPLATLIRLLALQAICWPATHLTLTVLEHQKRPVITWAVVATTTCVSRSIQLWVTSNLWWETRGVGGNDDSPVSDLVPHVSKRRGYWKRFGGGKWGGRRWDWGEVAWKCMFPAGMVYFVAFWADALRREWSGC